MIKRFKKGERGGGGGVLVVIEELLCSLVHGNAKQWNIHEKQYAHARTPKLFQIDIALTQHCHVSNIGVMGNELKIKITSCEIGAGSLSYLTWGIGLWPYGQIKIINNALLAKWLWECATDRCHLWKQIVEMKYGMDAMGLVLFCRNQSYVWDVHVEEFQKQLGGIFWLSSL